MWYVLARRWWDLYWPPRAPPWLHCQQGDKCLHHIHDKCHNHPTSSFSSSSSFFQSSSTSSSAPTQPPRQWSRSSLWRTAWSLTSSLASGSLAMSSVLSYSQGLTSRWSVNYVMIDGDKGNDIDIRIIDGFQRFSTIHDDVTLFWRCFPRVWCTSTCSAWPCPTCACWSPPCPPSSRWAGSSWLPWARSTFNASSFSFAQKSSTIYKHCTTDWL